MSIKIASAFLDGAKRVTFLDGSSWDYVNERWIVCTGAHSDESSFWDDWPDSYKTHKAKKTPVYPFLKKSQETD